MINIYAKRVAELDYKHDLGLRKREYNTVIGKLTRTKANYETEDEWLSAIDSIVVGYRCNPLQQSIQEQQVYLNRLCPICQKDCEPITLMRGRKAYYCKKHKAVSPAVITED